MQDDLEPLRERVLELARRSTLSPVVESVRLEADQDNYGSEFLRVLVTISDFTKTTDEDLIAFLETVVREVRPLDRRFPSVRFLDAA